MTIGKGRLAWSESELGGAIACVQAAPKNWLFFPGKTHIP